MNVKCIQTGQLDVNCYILTEGRDAAVIDPGGDCDRIIAALGDAELKMILLTHGILTTSRGFRLRKKPVRRFIFTSL